MARRYIKPADLPPDPALTNIYLRQALPRQDELGDESQAERIAANRSLAAIYRDQLKAGSVDPRLRNFFSAVSREIWMAADPAKAMREFLLDRPKRGAKPKSADRNFFIAVDVREKIEAGDTADAACDAVAKEVNLSFDNVRKIYFAENKVKERAIRAELGVRKMKAVTKSNP
jgi:hypothetical protein